MLTQDYATSKEAMKLEQESTKEIQATKPAILEIQRLLEKRRKEGKPSLGLRIGIRGGGCTGFSYLFEWADAPPKPLDRVFNLSENVQLFVDPKSFLYLQGMELDFVTSIMGYGFKFNNPNAKGACGCGESVQF